MVILGFRGLFGFRPSWSSSFQDIDILGLVLNPPPPKGNINCQEIDWSLEFRMFRQDVIVESEAVTIPCDFDDSGVL